MFLIRVFLVFLGCIALPFSGVAGGGIIDRRVPVGRRALMAKSHTQTQLDVLVLGDHPSAYLAAALLQQAKLGVAHACIPGEHVVDRLVMINPEFFELHPAAGSMKRKLDLTPIYGLVFLADNPQVHSSNVNKTIGAYVGSFKQIHDCMQKLAREAEVSLHKPRHLRVSGVDEKGVTVEMDGGGGVLRPKLLILAGELPPEDKRVLGLAPAWDGEVMHRYTFLRLKGGKWHAPLAKPVLPMSLDIHGTLNWAWLLPGNGQVQIAVDQSSQSMSQHPPAMLLKKWVDVLVAHGQLQTGGAPVDLGQAVGLDLPLSGALSQEGVANRTLLIGPAGGFYTACTEDIYPNCWSAVHAVEVAKQAVKERHLQDALQPYRQRWGATLGDYLRGPQQNLRFLLPLVYRNATMTARLADAILLGKSVVR